MKLEEEAVRYLTEAELEAFKKEEARERMELVRRVERGEITATEANREAFWFKGRVPSVVESPLNFADILSKAAGLRLAKKSNGRGKSKTVRT